MAGLSSRFSKGGYTLPKYMLYIKDKTLFNLAVSSFDKYFKTLSKVSNINSEKYPYNLLNSIFGRDNVWLGDHNEISLAVDKFIEKFTAKEKSYLDLIYKQRVSNRDARKTLALSDSEIRTLHNDILRKFRNPIFTDSLEKFIQEEDATKPLSDEKISKLLEEEGILVARRTVAKYRESMNIPGTSLRKRHI